MTEHVSRETPSRPDVAGGVFPSVRLPLAVRYAELLATEGVARGLIGPREAPRLWDRHLLNCAALSEVIPRSASVCDVGTGAGLPGLVVAIARPDLRITLVEPLLRRTSFLDEVVDELGLTHVEVVRGRAEALHGGRTFEVVTSRAVAPLGRLLQWSMPLVAPTGALLAMKGTAVKEEIAAARQVLTSLACAEPEVMMVGTPWLDPPTTVVRVAWSDPSRVGWTLVPAVSARRRGRGARPS